MELVSWDKHLPELHDGANPREEYLLSCRGLFKKHQKLLNHSTLTQYFFNQTEIYYTTYLLLDYDVILMISHWMVQLEQSRQSTPQIQTFSKLLSQIVTLPFGTPLGIGSALHHSAVAVEVLLTRISNYIFMCSGTVRKSIVNYATMNKGFLYENCVLWTSISVSLSMTYI